MYPGGPNPSQIQFSVPGGDAPPLLVLIHDGGGTTFSYFLLGSLGRYVWALHDVRFFDGLPWEGGVDEMASAYLELLVQAGIGGTLVLGGWSLGGFISVAMAHLVHRAEPDTYPFCVAGVLLVDSPYHFPRSRITRPVAQPRLDDLPDLVRTSFDHCDAMLQHWELPRWEGGRAQDSATTLCAGGREFVLRPGEVLYKPATGGAATWEIVSAEDGEGTSSSSVVSPAGGEKGEVVGEARGVLAPGAPPPAVLLRCTRRARTLGADPDVPCLVDLFRHERLLGWQGRYDPGFIKAVIDVDADHYGLFDRSDMDRMEDVTARMRWGLEILDGLQEPWMM